jgi:hypothetical protein
MLSITFYVRTTVALCLSVALSGCVASPPQPAANAIGDTRYANTPGYQSDFGAPVGGTAVAGRNGNSVSVAQGQILKAQQDHARKVWLTVQAAVLRSLEDDRRPPCHQRFLLKLDNGSTVLVAHNTDLAPRVPVSPGNVVLIRGEYIWNEKGGVLHWTHHDPQGTEEGGWILLNGQTYK